MLYLKAINVTQQNKAESNEILLTVCYGQIPQEFLSSVMISIVCLGHSVYKGSNGVLLYTQEMRQWLSWY